MSETVESAPRRQRRSEAVLDGLKDRLLAGHYRPGSRISIEEVRTELGVSKQPVMEAMRRLETIGIVQILPQSGCRVAEYSQREATDFFSLFARFEGEIAAAAARRRTEDQVASMDRTWDHIEELQEQSEPEDRARGYQSLNREFHLAIHRMAHSPVMADLSARMWDLSDFLIATRGGPGPLSDSLTERNEDHDLIRVAIASGRADVARTAMESHIIRTVDLISTDVDSSAF